jgi:hypothetical protein
MKKYFQKIKTKLNAREERIPVNTATLSFKDKVMEKSFLADMSERSLKLIRLSLLLAIGLYLLFGYLDDYIIPDAEDSILFVRILAISFYAAVILTSFSRYFKRFFQQIIILVVLFSGGDIIAMILLSEIFGGHYLYAGLILTVIYAHVLLRLRFIYASVCTWIIFLGYVILAVSLGSTPIEAVVNNTYFLFSANLIGMFGSYGIEFYMRSSFCKNLKLKEKSLQLESELLRKSHELNAARQVQLSMLPKTVPIHPLFDFSVSMKTASEIGGDYYDFHTADDQTITFAIGDATGHGAQAGAMVTATKMLFSNYAPYMDIIEFLEKADYSLKQINLPRLYMAFAIGRIKDDMLEIAGVGLPPLIIYRSASQTIEKIHLKGLPLGSYTSFPYEKKKINLFPGDILILMTDGFPELFNKESKILGYDRIDSILPQIIKNTPGKIISKLYDEADNWLNDYSQADDMTFMVLKMKETVPSNKKMQSLTQFSVNNFVN